MADKNRKPEGAGSADLKVDGDQSSFATPTISIPKGGGAIRGIGEKFGVNPVAGTGSLSVPIFTSPGRSNFGPQLSLSYDSGLGNGPFGFGWSLSLPSITRKTDKGLPRYQDAIESDVFILSGSEDLVPVFKKDSDGNYIRDAKGKLEFDEYQRDGYRIRRYRPRIEGLFALIERWTRKIDNDVHWRSISKDNILTVYGKDEQSRIVDPSDNRRIFSWLICESHDDKGNAVVYEYLAENETGTDLGKANELNRSRTANRYLKHIFYGNRKPLLLDITRPGFRKPHTEQADFSSADWMFELVFDYGDHDPVSPKPNDYTIKDVTLGLLRYPWKSRPDPFSSYRAGFEIRTYRLCHRVLMFHHFEGEEGVGNDCLVRSTDLFYTEDKNPEQACSPVYTFLKRITQSGYKRDNGSYLKRSLPPVEFEYSLPIVQGAVEEVGQTNLENLPTGLDGKIYQWIDLHGEGIPGILTEQSGAWFYKHNLSPVNIKVNDGIIQNEPKFGAVELIALKPNLALDASAQFMDLAGDGQPDLVIMDGPAPGLYEHDDHEGWQNFRAFVARLNHNTKDPNLRLVDLDGDGHADVLIAEDDAFVWHVSLAEDGFGPAQRVYQALDEEKGPHLIFADGTQSIHLADISGDGLTDLVQIRNGEICYWPNLGYGRFGARITMDHAPYFDNPDQFDQRRIRLADIDGSGTMDIIYLHRDGIRLYFNQSGNSWSEPQYLEVFPRVDDLVNIVPIDLLGNGTVCLVWSSPLPGDLGRQMRYVSLMGGEKPHLLVKTINNLGAEIRIHYAPSTKFYLQDKCDGKPWITRLPFPVHVVERVETYDLISSNLFVTRYAYHHGYFDGEEREFRGFGMIEQWDTEEFAAFAAGNIPADNISAASHVPPVHTKTWFHTGIYLGMDRVSRQFEHEYFREPGLTIETARPFLLDDTIVPPDLTLDEEREACRALKGSMLRQEVYADDAGPLATPEEIRRACTPYTVTEQNFAIRTLQRRGDNQHAVFFTHAREAISYNYERNSADPRIQHSITLEVDDFGNVLKQAAIGYGRRKLIRVVDDQGNVQQVPNPGLSGIGLADQAKQTTPLLTYTEKRVTNPIETSDTYRSPLPCEALTFELTGYTPTGSAGRFQASDLVEPDPTAPGRLRHKFTDQVSYEATATGNPCRRPIEWLRTLYRRDDLNGLLPLGELQPLALPGESYKLAFTPGLIAQVFQRPRQGQAAEPLLPNLMAVLGGQAGNRGGYLPSQALKGDGRFPVTDDDDHWWIPSGRSYFTANPADAPAVELEQAQQHFFLPRRYRDPFGQDALVEFDAHDLLMVKTSDALGNSVTVEANDYRVLQPRLVSDPNRNQTEVTFDTLGMVAGTAVMGKPLPAPVEGDKLIGFFADLTLSQLDQFMAAPRQPSPDPKESEATQIVHDLLQGATTRIVYDLERFMRSGEPAFAATIARENHVSSLKQGEKSKLQLIFSYSDGFGREIQKKIQAEPGPLDVHDPQAPIVNPRWVGSGWTIFNNKGKPVRQYEPFFDDTHTFKFAAIHGVSPVLFYDPAQRVIATLHPNHAYEKVVFDPWQQTTYDVNDTCAPRNRQTGDPRTDPDIGGYMAEYFKIEPAGWQTWYAQRVGGAMGLHERNAAKRAAAHADTPTTAHFDTLGRPFLTVARNRVVCPGHDLDGSEDSFATRVDLDIEGNQRAVWDERRLPVNHLPTGAIEQRVVMRYAYDMLGNRIHQISMEAGARWMLSDVAGKLIRAWDSRGHNFATKYDALRRPMEQTVRGTFSDPDPLMPNSDPRTLNRDTLVDKIEYGEGVANAEAFNLRTRIYRRFDSAGIATNARLDANGNITEAYDFKGNLLCSTRQLVSDYRTIPDWPDSQLDAETFEGSTRYDALNRPIQIIAPYSSLTRPGHPNKFNVIQPVFNEANLLERVDLWLERSAETALLLDPTNEIPSPVGVANIDYDPKGQRLRIDYKSGASTFYDYDELTFRLTHLYTRRGAAFSEVCDNPTPPPPTTAAPEISLEGKYCGLQNLHYTYDPAGNITHIQDDGQQTIYFKNKRVEPSNEYFYDALYRLIQATGREHLGQTGEPLPHSYDDAGRTARQHPNDGKAMGRYLERYVYDDVGNFLQMQHRGSDPAHAGWRRTYDYSEPSLIEESAKISNRLTRTTLHPESASPHVETYEHDAHGNMIRMPHLGGGLPEPNMHWDYKDQLRQADLGVGGAAYYVYDASGQRVRKVWEKAPGLTEERIYLGGFEIFRKHSGSIGTDTATLERETLHVMDDKQRVALVETRTLDTAGDDQAPRQLIRYQFGNHLGSTSLELDEQAQIISYEEYSPYGSTTYQAVRSQTETAKRYRYTGKERDAESGLYYHGARYYAPWLGRWATSDPSGLKDSICLYEYVHGNPVGLFDPDGQQSGTTQDLMMRMMWQQLSQEISGIITGFFGGSAYVDVARNKVEYSGPRGGVGGVVGGGVRALTFRAVPIEEYPTATSLMGMEVGAGLIPIFDPAERLVTGTTVTGQGANRAWAGVQLGLDVAPFLFEFRAATIEARVASAAERGSSVSLAFRPGLAAHPPQPIGHNMVGVNTGAGTEWSHLVVANAERSSPLIVTGGDALVVRSKSGPGSEYLIVTVPVSAEDAARAAAVAQARLETRQVGQYGLFCQDCTTYTSEVLNAAGVPTPPMSTPSLNYAAALSRAPEVVAPLRAAAGATTLASVGSRATYLEETMQQSIPSEHTDNLTYLEQQLQMSIPSEH
ncbi:MAG TPA: SpvB/TcaC N-terminal domain-containing protein [Methanothrix sp.]|jgi:RHS repeat-associated protein|uniref:SpvB/TcaC N-terminal domain-containing protein n=3 Tax=Methanothrix sp. TaxID=90426 RepID=UPI002CEF5CCE|nr:SpvB/TcaC N-terminal domain-containing protein [Euryarchaeota archaeon]HON35760.1 SpvB/TcaC N-terminal domain-containing protein [Methanothrix sp.]